MTQQVGGLGHWFAELRVMGLRSLAACAANRRQPANTQVNNLVDCRPNGSILDQGQTGAYPACEDAYNKYHTEMAFGASLVLATVAIVSLLLKFAVEQLMERDRSAVKGGEE
jgi:hypothetical protein